MPDAILKPDPDPQQTASALVGCDSNPADGLLLKGGAMLGWLGVVCLIGSNILGSVLLESHDWVADTVSDLAAGELEIIQDVGLYGFAAGLLGLALAFAHVRMPGRRWTVAIVALALLAADVTVIGARNEYGDADNDGVVIHIYLVYGLGLFLALLFFGAAEGLARIERGFGRVSRGCGFAWLLAAPLFFVLPTSVDGAWERGLGLICCVWVIAASRAVWRLSSAAGGGTMG